MSFGKWIRNRPRCGPPLARPIWTRMEPALWGTPHAVSLGRLCGGDCERFSQQLKQNLVRLVSACGPGRVPATYSTTWEPCREANRHMLKSWVLVAFAPFIFTSTGIM